jgi:hypothetical protein
MTRYVWPSRSQMILPSSGAYAPREPVIVMVRYTYTGTPFTPTSE